MWPERKQQPAHCTADASHGHPWGRAFMVTEGSREEIYADTQCAARKLLRFLLWGMRSKPLYGERQTDALKPPTSAIMAKPANRWQARRTDHSPSCQSDVKHWFTQCVVMTTLQHGPLWQQVTNKCHSGTAGSKLDYLSLWPDPKQRYPMGDILQDGHNTMISHRRWEN